MSQFKNRVFGCAIVRAINANYNADFTHQPRTLPDGTVYATDKAFKYSIRNYLIANYPNEKILYFKRLNENLNPNSLDETFVSLLGDFPVTDGAKKKGEIDRAVFLKRLLSCLDIRYFGATYAGKTNISIHGPVQINHATNRFSLGEIYSEQIMSPFRNPGKEGADEKGASTLGQQSKLREGHYVHHFSINPHNLTALQEIAGDGAQGLSENDISILKEAMCKGVSYYDSTSKAGCDNELLLWVQLKEESRTVLPVFTEYINVTRENGKVTIDFGKLSEVLMQVHEQIELMHVYFNPFEVDVLGLPDQIKSHNILTVKVA